MTSVLNNAFVTGIGVDRRPANELNDDLYHLEGNELAFYKRQTGIQDEAELKKHVIGVQRRAYKVCFYYHYSNSSC
jgi:hypothetical protein